MSDEQEGTTVTPEAAPAPAPAQETDWKAEARKWETRAKENSTAAARLAEIEEASKTELEKAVARAEQAETALTVKQAESMRLAVLAKYSIPEDYQDLIQGADEETLTASAVKVAALIEKDSKRPSVGPYVPDEGKSPAKALNSNALETALREKLGAR